MVGWVDGREGGRGGVDAVDGAEDLGVLGEGW